MNKYYLFLYKYLICGTFSVLKRIFLKLKIHLNYKITREQYFSTDITKYIYILITNTRIANFYFYRPFNKSKIKHFKILILNSNFE